MQAHQTLSAAKPLLKVACILNEELRSVGFSVPSVIFFLVHATNDWTWLSMLTASKTRIADTRQI